MEGKGQWHGYVTQGYTGKMAQDVGWILMYFVKVSTEIWGKGFGLDVKMFEIVEL